MTLIKIPNPELARKFIHLGICIFFYLSIYLLKESAIWILFGLSLVALVVADSSGLSRYLRGVGRKSSGQYFLVSGLVVVFLVHQSSSSLPALIFSFVAIGLADSLATLGPKVNKWLKHKQLLPSLSRIQLHKKTATGSLIFFVIVITTGLILRPDKLFMVFLATSALTLTELNCQWGLDNLLLPGLAYSLFLL